jgi:hypothetical protein
VMTCGCSEAGCGGGGEAAGWLRTKSVLSKSLRSWEGAAVSCNTGRGRLVVASATGAAYKINKLSIRLIICFYCWKLYSLCCVVLYSMFSYKCEACTLLYNSVLVLFYSGAQYNICTYLKV